MKIAILSCFYPFRGGIAQFNANLLTELGRSHDVRAFNFTRQYPAFLFPGKTQLVTPEDEAAQIESTAVLDTANPFNWSQAAKAIRSWGPDLLVLRYWMSYFAPSLGYVARKMAPGCKVVAILDNVVPHEQHFFDSFLTKRFVRSLSGSVTLCKEVAGDLLKLVPSAPHAVLHHPVYSHFGSRIPRPEAERALGLERGKKTLLFFGLIRAYKGLDILLRAFESLSSDYQLIIAGEPYGSFESYQSLIDSNPNRSRIHLYPRYIRDSEVKLYFSAADLAVLPYRSATQSGISAIATHFEVPMLVTDVGGLRETIAERGTGIVCTGAEPSCIASEIERYFSDAFLRSELSSHIFKANSELSWDNFCSKLLSFVNSIDKK